MLKTKIYIAVFSVVLLTACNNFLEVEPKASISDEATIFDQTSAQNALRGVYSALASGGYYGVSYQSIGYLSGDNIQWTGSQSQVQEFINHKVNADNSTISAAWSAIYVTINRANNVIAKVSQLGADAISETEKNRIVGEAYFIRALSYFDLVRVWGGVPLITEPTQSPTDNSGIARSSKEDTYALVLDDLNKAEALLKDNTDRFNATKKTVFALKARYYIYQQNWTEAEKYATYIIDDPDFQLIAPYSAFFANDARGTKESVFEIFYSTAETNSHSSYWQPQENGGSRRWAPNDELVSILTNPITGGGRSALIAKDNQDRWYGNLYYRNPGTDPAFVIRTAELYLIRAEARAHQDGKLGIGLADLNAVRLRAGLNEINIIANSADLLLAIENENRLEFAFEPHRWFDLVRTGRAKEVLNITEDFRLVLPLPAEQVRADKDALDQNEHY